jgi:hypothetical protein
MEHSERAREVTEQVALWIENDGERIEAARYKLGVYGVAPGNAFVKYLEVALRDARPYSAPWQVAQNLSPNDYDRIDWDMVAERIKAQG